MIPPSREILNSHPSPISLIYLSVLTQPAYNQSHITIGPPVTCYSNYDFPNYTWFAHTGPRSAVGNVSGYRCVSDCRSRGREFDPGPVPSHTFVEIDHEMISTVILLLPLIHSRRVVVSYKRKYVHELLVNRLFKPAQEKVWLGELTVPQ